MFRSEYTATLLVALLLIGMMAPLAEARDAGKNDTSGSQVKTDEKKTVHVKRGRNHTVVNAGDAKFGVSWGTSEDPGPVQIFAIYPRVLGEADVKSGDGTDLGRKTITSKVFVSHRILSVFEFQDRNGNHLYDTNVVHGYHKKTNDDNEMFEPRTGTAVLYTDWEYELLRETSGDVDIYTVRLTARDIQVWRWWHHGGSNDTLDLFQLDITLSVEQTEGRDVIPVYDVHMNSDANGVRALKDAGDREVEGRHTIGDFKYDVTINGWPAGSGDHLMVTTETWIGYTMYKNTAKWAGNILDKMGLGKAVVVEEGRTISTDKDPRDKVDPDGITKSIEAKDKIRLKHRVATVADISWVDNATVDGRDEDVRFNLISVDHASFSNETKMYRGIKVIGGYVYPIGENIHHDPGVFADSLEIGESSELVDLLPRAAVLFQMVIAVSVAVLAYVKRRK